MIPDFIKIADAMAMRYMYNGSITDMTVYHLFMIVNDSLKNFTVNFKVYGPCALYLMKLCFTPSITPYRKILQSFRESCYVSQAELTLCLVLFCFRMYHRLLRIRGIPVTKSYRPC